jgi:hypothetical protein
MKDSIFKVGDTVYYRGLQKITQIKYITSYKYDLTKFNDIPEEDIDIYTPFKYQTITIQFDKVENKYHAWIEDLDFLGKGRTMIEAVEKLEEDYNVQYEIYPE